jgi:Helix-turn-helix domain
VPYVGVAKLSGTGQLTSEATWLALTVADTESTRSWTTTGDDTELDDRQLRLIPHDAKGLQIATMVQVLADPVVGKVLSTRRTTSWAGAGAVSSSPMPLWRLARSQAGHPVVGRCGWGSAARRSWLEGPLFDVAQREEIALGRGRGQSIRSIAAAIRRAPSTVSRELRGQRRPAGRLPGHHGARPGLCPGVAAEDCEAGHQPGAAWLGGGRPGQEVLPGATRAG